jgi:hypothetical protein
MQLPNPFHQLIQSLVHLRQYSLFAPRISYAVHYLLWQLEVLRTRPLSLEGGPKLTVVLLSYKRVRNMQPIVRSLLRADFVERIIVSNNNPEYRIGEWITLRDERLRLVDQPRQTPAGIRFELARSEPGSYFLSIDDDVLLSPHQVKRLFQELLADPRVPHGIQGEEYLGPQVDSKGRALISWKPGIRRAERETDVINCVYAFTRQHLEEMFRQARALGQEMATLANGEDVLLSCSGLGRPRIHDLGPVLTCLSSHQVGVATWRTRQSFFHEREEMLFALRALRERRAVG